MILILLSIPSCGVRAYKDIVFDRGAEGYLKRAADANSVDLAKNELDIAIKYAESNALTSGYTSVLYRTPDEDVGFWYRNLKVSQSELQSLPDNATPLEKSNMLMKLRETLLDSGEKKVHVTLPSGISVFPNNTAYAIWLTISGLLLCGGIMLIMWGTTE
jgi:hypothetical protein